MSRSFKRTGMFCLRRDIIGTNMRLGRDRIVSRLGGVEDAPEFKQVPDPALITICRQAILNLMSSFIEIGASVGDLGPNRSIFELELGQQETV